MELTLLVVKMTTENGNSRCNSARGFNNISMFLPPVQLKINALFDQFGKYLFWKVCAEDLAQSTQQFMLSAV
jgi:hypothetical protein